MTTEDSESFTLEDLDAAPATLPRPGERIEDVDILEERLRSTQDENSRLQDEITELRQQLSEFRDSKRASEILNNLIEPYANKAFAFMCAYSGTVAIFLILDGFGTALLRIGLPPFSLPTSVLSLLVGSTAVTVIGLVGMVLTGIFVGARKQDRD